MRMILAVRGHRGAAAAIGIFEVLIWLLAVGVALEHLDSWLHIVGYAAGFAAGNYVGVSLEGRIAVGIKVVRAVFPEAASPEAVSPEAVSPKGEAPDRRATEEAAAHALREAGFAVTEMRGRGREGAVEILNLVVPRVSRLEAS
jgi:uncharacterized protein YebE (UPF0316 family)